MEKQDPQDQDLEHQQLYDHQHLQQQLHHFLQYYKQLYDPELPQNLQHQKLYDHQLPQQQLHCYQQLLQRDEQYNQQLVQHFGQPFHQAPYPAYYSQRDQQLVQRDQEQYQQLVLRDEQLVQRDQEHDQQLVQRDQQHYQQLVQRDQQYNQQLVHYFGQPHSMPFHQAPYPAYYSQGSNVYYGPGPVHGPSTNTSRKIWQEQTLSDDQQVSIGDPEGDSLRDPETPELKCKNTTYQEVTRK